MTDKIYVGGGKAIQTQYGQLLKISFNRDDLQKLLDNVNQAGWVNLNVNERKTPSQYGQTHSITIDDWTPDKAKKLDGVKQATEPSDIGFDDFNDDIPF